VKQETFREELVRSLDRVIEQLDPVNNAVLCFLYSNQINNKDGYYQLIEELEHKYCLLETSSIEPATAALHHQEKEDSTAEEEDLWGNEIDESG